MSTNGNKRIQRIDIKIFLNLDGMKPESWWQIVDKNAKNVGTGGGEKKEKERNKEKEIGKKVT